jgi:hypothetical protein
MIKISIRSRDGLHRETRAAPSPRIYAALRRFYPTEIAPLLHCTRRGAARPVFGLLVPLAFFVAGCSSDTQVGRFFGAIPPEAEPPAAEGRPYPNLASVPRPPTIAPRAEREAEVARLQADQAAAASADRALRERGEVPAAAPPAPAVVEAPAPAPAATPPVLATPVLMTATPAPTITPAPPALPSMAQAQVPAATVLRRVGAVAFARDGTTLSEVGQRALAEAAAAARTGNGRVRLIPAQVARQAPTDDLVRARRDAIAQALGRAGLAADRVRIDDGGGRRVDVYDLYVEY